MKYLKNEIQIEKASHHFLLRPLIFKLRQGIFKFSDISVSWSSPKTNLETCKRGIF